MQNAAPGKNDAEAFCGHCRWVCKCWLMNRAVNMAAVQAEFGIRAKTRASAPGQFLIHYFNTSGPYTLLQIGKLHESPSAGGPMAFGYPQGRDR